MLTNSGTQDTRIILQMISERVLGQLIYYIHFTSMGLQLSSSRPASETPWAKECKSLTTIVNSLKNYSMQNFEREVTLGFPESKLTSWILSFKFTKPNMEKIESSSRLSIIVAPKINLDQEIMIYHGFPTPDLTSFPLSLCSHNLEHILP